MSFVDILTLEVAKCQIWIRKPEQSEKSQQ